MAKVTVRVRPRLGRLALGHAAKEGVVLLFNLGLISLEDAMAAAHKISAFVVTNAAVKRVSP